MAQESKEGDAQGNDFPSATQGEPNWYLCDHGQTAPGGAPKGADRLGSRFGESNKVLVPARTRTFHLSKHPFSRGVC